MPNLLQTPVTILGVLRAGCVVVNVNPLYTVRDLEHQLKDSDTTAIFILANFADTLEKSFAHTDVKHIVVTQVGDMVGGLKKHIVNFVVKHIKKMVPKFNLPNTIKFSDVLAADEAKYTRPEMSLSDLAFLQYTGGTTGVSN